MRHTYQNRTRFQFTHSFSLSFRSFRSVHLRIYLLSFPLILSFGNRPSPRRSIQELFQRKRIIDRSSIPSNRRYLATRSGHICRNRVYASCASPTFQKYGAHINLNTHKTPHMIVAAIAINSGSKRITIIQNHTSVPLLRVTKAIIPAKRNKISPVSNKGSTHHHSSVMAVTAHLRSAVGAVFFIRFTEHPRHNLSTLRANPRSVSTWCKISRFNIS